MFISENKRIKQLTTWFFAENEDSRDKCDCKYQRRSIIYVFPEKNQSIREWKWCDSDIVFLIYYVVDNAGLKI